MVKPRWRQLRYWNPLLWIAAALIAYNERRGYRRRAD